MEVPVTADPAPVVDAGQAPGLIIRGRYALLDAAGGKMRIPWSVGPCDRCATCGCGDQMEPFELPAPVAGLIRAKLNGEDLPMMGKLKAMRGKT
jgi:hypothetical protein